MCAHLSYKIHKTSSVFDMKNKTWSGPKEDLIFGPDVSIGRSILESLSKNPDHISQICDNNGHKYSNKDIRILSICFAQRLQDLGIEQEDIIGISASNTDFLAPLVFGSLLCGATICPLYPSNVEDGIRNIFPLTKPKLMFCDGKIYQMVKDSFDDIDFSIPIYTMKDHLEGVRSIEEFIVSNGKETLFVVKPLTRGSSQTAAILSTSGTTKLAKIVCVSHESLINELFVSLNQFDKLLCFSLVSWLSGIRSLLHGTITGCTRVITDQMYSPELFLIIIEKYKINIVFSLSSYLVKAVRCLDFTKRNLSSLEVYFCGGSVLPFAVVQEFAHHVKGCKIISRYGMSEICGTCSMGTPTRPRENGRLKSNVTVKIIDDAGKKLGIGETGEICIKYAFRWSGYYGNPAATNETCDQDGFIHSGDLGYFDKNGSLLIVDRKKDMIKYNGFDVSPSEIEEVITEIPNVIDVCVCGIPDDVSNFLPAAAVIKVSKSSLTETDIANYVGEKMAHFNHLRGGVFFVDSFPTTSSGKKIRAKITEMVEFLKEKKNSVLLIGMSNF